MRETSAFILEKAWTSVGGAVQPDGRELADFQERRGPFLSEPGDPNDIGSATWWSFFKDVKLWKTAKVLVTLPASTADVERVLSAAAVATEGRECLGDQTLKEEVYLKWNISALPASFATL